ncbi:MAG: hypothetical protein ACRERU_22580 [Methylococcales bacterium]
MNKLRGNDGSASAMIAIELLPVNAAIDPDRPVFVDRPTPLTELGNSRQAVLSYVNLRYEESLKRLEAEGQAGAGRRLPKNPVDGAPVPENCFKTQGLHLYFLKECGKRGERKNLFWDWEDGNITAVRLSYPLEADPMGLEREVQAGEMRGIQNEGAVQVSKEIGQDGNKFIQITIDRVRAGIFDARARQTTDETSIEIREQLRFVGGSFDLGLLKEWSAAEEPCQEGPDCERLKTKTVHLSDLVESLIIQGNGLAKTEESLQSNVSTGSARLEFQAVDRLP